MHLVRDILRAVHSKVTTSRFQRGVQRGDVLAAIADGYLVLDTSADGAFQVFEAYGEATGQPYVLVTDDELWLFSPSHIDVIAAVGHILGGPDDVTVSPTGWTVITYVTIRGERLAKRVVRALSKADAYDARAVDAYIVMAA
jgi:hypothetical protein